MLTFSSLIQTTGNEPPPIHGKMITLPPSSFPLHAEHFESLRAVHLDENRCYIRVFVLQLYLGREAMRVTTARCLDTLFSGGPSP